MDTSAGSGEGWEDFVRIHRGVCNRIMLVHDTLTEYAHADPERQQEMQAELGKEVQNFVNDLFEGASALAMGTAALGVAIMAF